MPRRQGLRRLTNDVLFSFVSRNNDVDGYWALGKLRAHAEASAVTVLSIDLFGGCVASDSIEFEAMIETYRAMVVSLVERQHFREGSVSAAAIVRDSAPTPPLKTKLLAFAGDRFLLRLDLIDDLDKLHDATVEDACIRHDPSREHRRCLA